DMIAKLERARDRLPDDGGPYLASIILDGENAWEQYPNNGNDSLRTLYGRLQSDERFETVRVSDFLAANPATVEPPLLHTGSWTPRGSPRRRSGAVPCCLDRVSATANVGRLLPGGLGYLRPPAEIELAAYGVDLRGRRVADIGAGEGRLALGAARGAKTVLAV